MDSQQLKHFEVLDFLDKSRNIIPGFQQAYAFYFHPISKDIKAAQANNTSISEVINSDVLVKGMNKLRKSSQAFEWVDEAELPFERQRNTFELQKEVFDEYKHHILLYRIKSDFDNKYDLLYIYFRADASNFGIKGSNSKLSTDQKSIIATLLESTFIVLHNQRKENNKYIKLLLKDADLLREQLHIIDNDNKIDEYKTQIQNYIISIMKLKADKLNVILQLSNDANEYIKDYKGDIIDIEANIENSLLMAYRSQNTFSSGILNIDKFHLQAYLDNKKNGLNQLNSISYADNRKEKAAQFLNNLENAARKTQALGNNITSSNVGQAMDSPITAPAISDYIKKYKKPLQQLCNDNPNQWQLIQKSFTPIRNMIAG